MVSHYFKAKRRELEGDLEGYLSEVTGFIETLPAEESESIIR